MVSTSTSSEKSKAFLSHSSVDKPFVEAVALRIGRVQVFLDKWCFETGDAFIKAIPTALDATELYVLFASRASLASMWVQLEMEHAETLMASSVLKKAIVFLIDDQISHSDLPKWMQNNLSLPYSSPNAVARVIQSELDKLRGVKQREYFFGRDQLVQEFTQSLYPAGDVLPPNILVIAGLSGMGRRTFARKILEERMYLRMGATFHLKKSDGMDALHLALILETSPLATKDEVSKNVLAYQAASDPEKNQELVRLLVRASENNVAPVILDDGALFESNGSYTESARTLLAEIRKIPSLVVVFIQSRVPTMARPTMANLGISAIKVSQLNSEASRQFLSRRMSDNSISATSEQIDTLVPHLNGYPPVFNIAASYAKEYGLPVLLNNKTVLTSFQQQEFADLLDQLDLNTIEWGILRLLAAGLEIPVEGLMIATGQAAAVIVAAVHRLVDFSLILNNSGILAIARPLTYAIQAARGTILPKEYAFIGKSLKAAFWDTQDALPDYGILEATISCLLKSDETDLTDFKGIVVPSMLFRNAKYHYERSGHDHWLTAKKLLDSLLELQPQDVKAMALLMKIYVRLRRFPEAEALLQRPALAKTPARHFLEGFLLWKRRRYTAAIPHFETALNLGQEATEIYHGLAICQFRLGRLDDAQKTIRKGLRGKARANVLLVDLAAQIAIDKNELEEAEKYIEQLRRLKADADYHHRKATLLNVRHNAKEALTHARKASQNPRARFENKTTLISTLIDVQQYPEAGRELDNLDNAYRLEDDRKDVRIGLRCKLLLRQGKWKQAEPLWEELLEKDTPVHAALRKEILVQTIGDKQTSLRERNDANLELLRWNAAPSLDSLSFPDIGGGESRDSEDEDL